MQKNLQEPRYLSLVTSLQPPLPHLTLNNSIPIRSAPKNPQPFTPTAYRKPCRNRLVPLSARRTSQIFSAGLQVRHRLRLSNSAAKSYPACHPPYANMDSFP